MSQSTVYHRVSTVIHRVSTVSPYSANTMRHCSTMNPGILMHRVSTMSPDILVHRVSTMSPCSEPLQYSKSYNEHDESL